MSKTFKIQTPRGLELFVTLVPNDDGRLLMSADIPTKGISGYFLACHRMPKPEKGATHFIEINYKTPVGLDEYNASLLKAEIAEMREKMESAAKKSRFRK